MDAEHGHVMLCGNPAMIKEMRTMLKEQREMQLHTPRRHGQVHIERYW
jgi:ferredoxin--NADP+ reductase